MSPAVRASALGPAFDLAAAYGPAGFLLEREGLGVAAPTLDDAIRIGPEPDLAALARRASEVLADLRSDPAGPTPVALGALPFAAGPATLSVARRTVARLDPGETWLLGLGGADGSDAAGQFRAGRIVGDLPHEAFEEVQLTEVPPAEAYGHAVVAAASRIAAGELRKVVLARTLRVDAGRPLDPRPLVRRLRAVEPHGYAFAVPTAAGTLVGASPELLVARRGTRVRSTPLAGTAPRSGDPVRDRANAEALVASAKDREEHAAVVESVADALGPRCSELTFDAEPVLEATANVWHLATRFHGTLRDPSVTALDLVAALHPTPAVCGSPRGLATATIAELEGIDRGGYAGPVGWVDADGDGEWAIALRCAALDGERATLFAGAGIVAASDPAAEIDETGRKFRAFLDSLRWG